MYSLYNSRSILIQKFVVGIGVEITIEKPCMSNKRDLENHVIYLLITIALYAVSLFVLTLILVSKKVSAKSCSFFEKTSLKNKTTAYATRSKQWRSVAVSRTAPKQHRLSRCGPINGISFRARTLALKRTHPQIERTSTHEVEGARMRDRSTRATLTRLLSERVATSVEVIANPCLDNMSMAWSCRFSRVSVAAPVRGRWDVPLTLALGSARYFLRNFARSLAPHFFYSVLRIFSFFIKTFFALLDSAALRFTTITEPQAISFLRVIE